MKKIFFTLLLLILTINIYAQLRSFNQIFPNAGNDVHDAVFNESGYVKSSKRTNGFVIIGNNSALDSRIINNVLSKNPGFLVESVSIIQKNPGTVSVLDIYNALGNIRGLQGRLYDSASKGRPSPLFEEATRIVSNRQTTPIPDPAPVRILPLTETIYIRLKDANFGNTYYRGDIAVLKNGLSYTLTNCRNMSYLFITAIREEKFTAQLYIEPIAEGVLIYSISGADVSDFISSRIHMESAISKRLAVITEWATDEITRRTGRY